MDFAISLYDALIAINVPAEKAKAVVSALEKDMTTVLATKDDLQNLTTVFDLKLKAQTNSMVIRLGAIVVAAMAALEALHKFL
jgi:hypothetical protein